MARPYQKANIPGPEQGTSVYDPKNMANILKDNKKKVFVIGSESLNWELGLPASMQGDSSCKV